MLGTTPCCTNSAYLVVLKQTHTQRRAHARAHTHIYTHTHTHTHIYIYIYIYIYILYIYIYQFTRSPPLAPLAEQPWVARFFFLAIETWDVIASKIGSSKLHSIFTSPIEAPITGCAHRHRQRPQHPSDRTHQMSDIPRDQN